MVRVSTRGRALALTVLFVLEAARVQAAPADSRAVEARKACAAGNVDRGIDLLAELVAETGDPNAVYNQARCYQQNGRARPALDRFREYLRIARGIPAAERAEVNGHIRELEAELVRAITPPPIVPPAAAPEPRGGPAQSVDAGLAATAGPRDAGRSRRLRLLGIATGGLGVAAVASGMYFSYQVSRLQGRIEGQRGPVPAADLRRELDRGERYESLQWVGYGVGAAALTGGVLLYLLGRPGEGPARLVAMVVPAPAGGPPGVPAGGAALLRGSF